MMTAVPGRTRRLTSRRPTTAGTFSERARMAVWWVRPPASVTKPSTRDQSICAASEAVSSSATSTAGPSTSCSRSLVHPLARRRFMRTRPATSARSLSRSRKYGSSTVANTAHSSS